MGQKVNPHGLRVGVIKDWDSRWYDLDDVQRHALAQLLLQLHAQLLDLLAALADGRLNGAEIARTEHYHDGTIPLQTIRADIEYGFAEAHTTYGRLATLLPRLAVPVMRPRWTRRYFTLLGSPDPAHHPPHH